MSSRYRVRLARESDDEGLRAVLRATPMPGSISLAFSREPSFFIAEQAGNLGSQTIVYEDQETGRLVGTASRCLRRAYVDGNPRVIGYLGGLRLLPEARNRLTLAQGFRFLRELHQDHAVPYYLTTILEENTAARRILESGRAGLPRYLPVGTLITYCMPIPRRFQKSRDDAIQRVVPSSRIDAFQCVETWNRKHQFAPAYDQNDITGRSKLLPRFSEKNTYTCIRSGKVTGTLNAWSQLSFKQTEVTGYTSSMQLLRLPYNAVARMRGNPVLPHVGGAIRSVYAALMSVQHDDPSVLDSLLQATRADLIGQPYDYLILGLAEDSPLNIAARRSASQTIRSKIYLVHWPEEAAELPKTKLPIHLEVATL